MVAAINALFNFFRIFQFFQFSYKLSSFSEMLKDSKTDIIYFMIMFCIIVLGFSVMASTFYGENIAQFSDFLATLN